MAIETEKLGNHKVQVDDVMNEGASDEAVSHSFSTTEYKYVDEYNPGGLKVPTQEDQDKLRKIVGEIPISCYLICLVELAERGSYYSVSEVLTNFIQRPLPKGSSTGAPLSDTLSEVAGALNMGLQVSSAMTLLLTFLAYVVPLYGGYLGDAKLGRFKAIWVGILAGFISHVLFVIAAIPSVIADGKAIAPCVLGILTLALSTGFIKPNLIPFLLDQYPYKTDLVKTLPSGERVIIDRELSIQSVVLIFYWATNLGAFFQLGASYAERRIGFWLAFFFPTIMYLILPIVMLYLNKKMTKTPPAGSILTNVLKILKVTIGGILKGKAKSDAVWEYARPNNMIARGRIYYNEKKQSPITWNDQWVKDVRKTLDACKIFIYFPIFFINDGGIGGIETSLAGSMTTKGVPNDLFVNFNPLTIIVELPLLNYVIYPLLRKYRINFAPIYRITLGFIIAASSQMAGAIIQHQVYQTSPCGYNATTCDEKSPETAWKVASLYILGAAGGGLSVTTAYELSYSRSPPHMKGFVLSLFLFTTAISAAISQAVTPALKDPYLIWPFAACAIAGYVAAIVFFFHFKDYDKIKYDGEVTPQGNELELIILK